MAYDNDVTVYVEDIAGDQGGKLPGPWWLSPDVDLPSHSGLAVQGTNDVKIRVHARDEPFIDAKIVAEVYVCEPSLAMSPTAGSKRIDPGNLRFRPSNVPGTETVADVPGGTAIFPWTTSSASSQPDGPGHRCLVLRAFPEGVTPPSSPFDVANEQHEAQHNIEIVSTQMDKGSMSEGGAGTPEDPRKRDSATGLWWESLLTIGVGEPGTRFVVWSFDPVPEERLPAGVLRDLKKAGVEGFGQEPPNEAAIEVVGTQGNEVDPLKLVEESGFAAASGVGDGVFSKEWLLGAASLELDPSKPARVVLRFDHSNLEERTALVLHAAQWDERGNPEGGMTIVALAPVDP